MVDVHVVNFQIDSVTSMEVVTNWHVIRVTLLTCITPHDVYVHVYIHVHVSNMDTKWVNPS